MIDPTKDVVITGASTGIGRACALHLDQLGWRVFAGVRKAADGEALRAEASGRLVPLMIDVTDARSIERAREEVAAGTGQGGLWGLVNNAGVSVPAPLELVPLQEFREQLEVNVTGQLAVTQAFLPMLRSSGGRIVFMGSVLGRVSVPLLGAYCVSKYALEAMVDALRVELLPWNIDVAIVEPGSVASRIWEKGHAAADVFEARLDARGHELYGRAFRALRDSTKESEARGLPPVEVAKVVAHALSAKRPKTRYVVGTDARIQIFLSAILSDRLWDRFLGRSMKLPGRP